MWPSEPPADAARSLTHQNGSSARAAASPNPETVVGDRGRRDCRPPRELDLHSRRMPRAAFEGEVVCDAKYHCGVRLPHDGGSPRDETERGPVLFRHGARVLPDPIEERFARDGHRAHRRILERVEPRHQIAYAAISAWRDGRRRRRHAVVVRDDADELGPALMTVSGVRRSCAGRGVHAPTALGGAPRLGAARASSGASPPNLAQSRPSSSRCGTISKSRSPAAMRCAASSITQPRGREPRAR